MTGHQQLIRTKLEHLERMGRYLKWSLNQVKAFLPIRLSEFFRLLAEETPALLGYAGKLTAYCNKHYPAE